MKNGKILQKAAFALDKEIKALLSVRTLLGKDFIKAVDLLSRVRGRIVVSGIGKSGQIGMKISSTMLSLGIPAVYLNPAEAVHGDLGVVGPDDAVVALSASGETKELMRVLKHVHRHVKIPIVAITWAPRSSLNTISDVALVFKVKEEGSPYNLAPMASAAATLAVGDMLAAALSAKKGFKERDFADFHPGGALGLRLAKVSELSKKRAPLPIVKKADPFAKVLKVMSRGSLGVAAVVDARGRLAGVVTDGDVRRFLLGKKSPAAAAARDLMTARPKTVGENESLEEALRKMEDHKITSLFVTGRGGRLAGVILMHDIVEHKML